MMSSIVRILAIETSTLNPTITLSMGQNIISKSLKITEGSCSQLSSKLIVEIENLLDKGSINYSDLDFVLASRGPGSFTGIRVGLSFINGLKLTTNSNFFTITTNQILAYSTIKLFSYPKEFCLSLINTKNKSFYGQIFDKNLISKEELRIWNINEVKLILSNEDYIVSSDDYYQMVNDNELDYDNHSKYDNKICVNQSNLSEEMISFFKKNFKLKGQEINDLYFKNDLNPFYFLNPTYKTLSKE